MSPDFEDVKQFHLKFGQPTDNDGAICLMTDEQLVFRTKFLREELDEFEAAFHREQNLVKQVDSLIDFVYVCYGTALFMHAGQQHFKEHAWPTFQRVRSEASRLGFAPPEDAIKRSPMPMTVVICSIILERLRHEIYMFGICHRSGDHRAASMALAHLWNAAWCAYHAASEMDVPWDRCWRHVQIANMGKVRAKPDGSDSTRQSSWDVVKPSGWSAPDAKIAMELQLDGAPLQTHIIAAAQTASQPRA